MMELISRHVLAFLSRIQERDIKKLHGRKSARMNILFSLTFPIAISIDVTERCIMVLMFGNVPSDFSRKM